MSGFEILKTIVELAPNLMRIGGAIRSFVSRFFGRTNKTESGKTPLSGDYHLDGNLAKIDQASNDSDRRRRHRRWSERRAAERRDRDWKMNGRREEERRQDERRASDRRQNERRQAKRCPVQAPIFLKIDKQKLQGQLCDLSKTGAQILALHACHSNDRVVIKLRNPKTSKSISIPGKVVWWKTAPHAQTQPAHTYRFGLHFDHKLPAEPTAFFPQRLAN